MTNSRYKLDNYSKYTWVLTILLAPLFWIVFYIITNGSSSLSLFEMLPAFYTLGLILSLPSFIMVSWIYNYLERKISSNLILKSLTTLLGVSSIYITFLYIGGSWSMELAFFYSLTLTFLIWIIKPNRKVT